MIPQAINIYLQDSTHETFDIEEEDQIKALKDSESKRIILFREVLVYLMKYWNIAYFAKDLELKNLLLELQGTFNKVLEELGMETSTSESAII